MLDHCPRVHLIQVRALRAPGHYRARCRGQYQQCYQDFPFVILGVTIRTDGGTVFRDVNDAVIDAATFFGQAEGHLVEADGTLTNGVIAAEEVELED